MYSNKGMLTSPGQGTPQFQSPELAKGLTYLGDKGK